MTLDKTYQHILKTCKAIILKELFHDLLDNKKVGLYEYISGLNFINNKLIPDISSRILDKIKDRINYELRTFDFDGEMLFEILKDNPNKKITEYTKIRDLIEQYLNERVCNDLQDFVESDNFYNYLLELITGRNISTFTDDELEQGGDTL